MPLPRISARPPDSASYTTIGSMNAWITLLAPGARTTDGGQANPSPVISTWASIRAMSGQELYKAQQIVPQVTHLVTVPYQPGIAAAMEINYQDRIFQIEAVQDPDERQVELRLLCIERNQNG